MNASRAPPMSSTAPSCVTVVFRCRERRADDLVDQPVHQQTAAAMGQLDDVAAAVGDRAEREAVRSCRAPRPAGGSGNRRRRRLPTTPSWRRAAVPACSVCQTRDSPPACACRAAPRRTGIRSGVPAHRSRNQIGARRRSAAYSGARPRAAVGDLAHAAPALRADREHRAHQVLRRAVALAPHQSAVRVLHLGAACLKLADAHDTCLAADRSVRTRSQRSARRSDGRSARTANSP